LDLLVLSREGKLGAYRHSPELGSPRSLQKQVVEVPRRTPSLYLGLGR
jgi:hypothetical protein